MRIGSRKTTGKILASVVLVGATASVAGLGTFGGFTSTTTASQSTSAGEVVLGSSAGGGHGVAVAADNLVPGDTVQRTITLTRAGETEAFGSVWLTTSGQSANALTAAGGLQLAIDQCSVPWTPVGTTSELACSGTTSAVVAQRAVLGSEIDLAAATETLNGSAAASNLRVQLTLPGDVDNTVQGLSTVATYTSAPTPRPADSR